MQEGSGAIDHEHEDLSGDIYNLRMALAQIPHTNEEEDNCEYLLHTGMLNISYNF